MYRQRRASLREITKSTVVSEWRSLNVGVTTKKILENQGWKRNWGNPKGLCYCLFSGGKSVVKSTRQYYQCPKVSWGKLVYLGGSLMHLWFDDNGPFTVLFTLLQTQRGFFRRYLWVSYQTFSKTNTSSKDIILRSILRKITLSKYTVSQNQKYKFISYT